MKILYHGKIKKKKNCLLFFLFFKVKGLVIHWFSAFYFSSNLLSKSSAYNRGQREGRHLKHVGIVGMSDGPDKGEL